MALYESSRECLTCDTTGFEPKEPRLMGVDMYARNVRVKEIAGYKQHEGYRGDDPWYFHLNWGSMSRLVNEMDRALAWWCR